MCPGVRSVSPPRTPETQPPARRPRFLSRAGAAAPGRGSSPWEAQVSLGRKRGDREAH